MGPLQTSSFDGRQSEPGSNERGGFADSPVSPEQSLLKKRVCGWLANWFSGNCETSAACGRGMPCPLEANWQGADTHRLNGGPLSRRSVYIAGCTDPAHIEIQVLAASRRRILSRTRMLYQRRIRSFWKSSAVVSSPDLRKRMATAAVAACGA